MSNIHGEVTTEAVAAAIQAEMKSPTGAGEMREMPRIPEGELFMGNEHPSMPGVDMDAASAMMSDMAKVSPNA